MLEMRHSAPQPRDQNGVSLIHLRTCVFVLNSEDALAGRVMREQTLSGYHTACGSRRRTATSLSAACRQEWVLIVTVMGVML